MIDERICNGVMAGYGMFETIKKTREIGFKGIMLFPGGENHSHSLGEFPTLNWYNAGKEENERLKEEIKYFKNITLHQAWDERYKDWISCAKYFGAKVLTIHAGIARKPYFSEILKYKGIKIGIENEGGKLNDYMDLIGSINSPHAGATIDFGHCAYFEEVKTISDLDKRAKKLNEVILYLIERLNKKITHFHIHNVRKYKDIDFSKIPFPYWKENDFVDHRCVDEGLINYKEVFSLLKKINYQGLFDIELEEPQKEEKAKKSGEYITRLLQ